MAETRMFILTDVISNNNKFWEISIDDAGVVSSRNGRVGSAGQSRSLGHGDALFQSKIREKTRKGYHEIAIIGAQTAAPVVDKVALKSAAEEQIGKGDPVITDLVRKLAEINRHQILSASGGQMNLDLSTGVISTPVGVVTLDNINKARLFLDVIQDSVLKQDFDSHQFINNLQEYLMLVPQKVGSRKGWHRDFIPGQDAIVSQGSLLDQLEASIEIAEQRVRDAQGATSVTPSQVFDVTMSISEDPALRKRINAYFEATRKSMHASANLKISRIFNVSLGNMARDYEDDGAKLGGVMELWHGTRAHNLLSILKSGLIVPRQNGSIHVTGRMFGNGIYFSDQSTKSLNYAYGYWDGGAKDNRSYMFLADVAMGKFWHPDRTGASVKPPAGYDSVFARGGKDIVANNEMIVFRTSQVNLKYLVEFE